MSIKKLLWIIVMLLLMAVLSLVITSRIQVSSDVIFGGADSVFIDADGLLKPLDGYDINKSSNAEAPSGLIYPKITITDPEFILVNADDPIGSYVPVLATVSGTEFKFAKLAVRSLEELLRAAEHEGYTPHIVCAYRSYNSQSLKYNGKVKQISYAGQTDIAEAMELANGYVEYPGCSEHQTGLAVNISDKEYGTYDEADRDSPLYVWLDTHCAEYGFIKRYPQNRSDITGRDEYWHYRYVGKEAASFIMENALCLEQFEAHYIN